MIAAYFLKAKLSSGIFHEPGGGNYDRIRAERCYVDPDAATARYEQGILKISLPIAAKPVLVERYTIVVERR